MKLNIPNNAYLKRINLLRSWAFYSVGHQRYRTLT